MTTTVAPTTATQLPGYVAGRWAIDQVHSDLSFTVRHMMVSKVRGHFRDFEGEIVTAEDPRDSQVTATIRVGSVDTNNPQRDQHLSSSDFFDSGTHPTATFRSTSVRPDDGGYLVDGELTLRGVTKSITLAAEVNGIGPDVFGGTRLGLTARGKLSRSDFGVSFGLVTEGIQVVSDTIDLAIEIEAVLQPEA
jgi:polyisoprenoid-binding protein YceI